MTRDEKMLRVILDLPYGSPAQIEQIDRWYRRFARFAATHPILTDTVWGIHLSDVVYLARQRWLNITLDHIEKKEE